MKVVRKTLIDSDSENSSNTQTPEQILSSCLDTIGMGRYQWKLFMLCGLGWAADNMYLQAVSTIQIPAQLEFGLSNVQVAFLTSAMMGGMLVGATFWGASSDVIGRKPAFMMTLGITAIFNICAAFAPSYTMLTVALLLMGFGVGGNLPVDGALFLEFVPTDKQSLLALMSLFWPMGQFIASVVAWILIPTNTCTLPCQPNENMGWRYVEFTLGIITIVMVVCRVLLFDLLESPKYLLARGDFDGTARVLNKLAEMNNVVLEVTANDFRDAPGRAPTESQAAKLRSLFSPDIRATTIIVWLIWMFVALGNNMFFGFLPKFLKANGGGAPLSDAETYRNYLIVSASSVPGSILGQWGCDSFLGRKYTQALSTFGLVLALGAFVIFTSSTEQLVATCIAGMLQNIMYGAIYAYAPEVFPTKVRGTAVGLASSLGRLTGSIAPILTGALMDFSFAIPLYFSAGFLALTGLFMVLLPIETRGRPAH